MNGRRIIKAILLAFIGAIVMALLWFVFGPEPSVISQWH